MTDITPDFNICLKAKGVPPVLKKEYDIQTINSFLHEAYTINARVTDLIRHLRVIRPSYLSVALPSRRRQTPADQSRARPLTDKERESFDAESKKLLRELGQAIRALKQAEDVRYQTADSVALQKRAKGGLGAIGRWAAGGAVTAKSPEEEIAEAERNTVAAARNSVITYLGTKLEEASTIQSEMMGVRLSREVEKSKSILAKSSVTVTMSHGLDDQADGAQSHMKSDKRKRISGAQENGALDALNSPRQELTAEQLQLFAEENHELLKHYEDQMDQIRTAEKSILEISELHSTLHSNLTQQSEHIEQLVQDSYMTTENLGKGNKELKRASERRSAAQTVFYSTVAFCSFLVVWDLVF